MAGYCRLCRGRRHFRGVRALPPWRKGGDPPSGSSSLLEGEDYPNLPIRQRESPTACSSTGSPRPIPRGGLHGDLRGRLCEGVSGQPYVTGWITASTTRRGAISRCP